MSSKSSKRMRRMMRKEVKKRSYEIQDDFIKFINKLSFWRRWRLAMQILTGTYGKVAENGRAKPRRIKKRAQS